MDKLKLSLATERTILFALVGQHLSRSLLVPVSLSLLICFVSALDKGESHFTKPGRRSMPSPPPQFS